MKRPASTFLQFRQRIPADVLERARGCPLAIPVGDGVVSLTIAAKAETLQFSLRTRDPREAKARQGIAAAYLERVWRGLREGPTSLTQRNITALAGEVYGAWTGALGDAVDEPATWAAVRADNAAARRGAYGLSAGLLIGDDDDCFLHGCCCWWKGLVLLGRDREFAEGISA